MKSVASLPVSRPSPAADHHSARISDQTLQAEAFLGMFSRLGPPADLGAEFERWAASKDFSPRDRSAISREVRHILAQRGQP
jgi:hypothetical protein